MDEAERCTAIGFISRGQLLVKDHPRALKQSFRDQLLELEVDPVMPALAALRENPDVLGVALRSGRVRIYAEDPRALLAKWQAAWPYTDLRWTDHSWVDADMEDVFSAYSQGFSSILHPVATAAQ
jgi:hypothetical protein